jgi:hypothetical protein
MQVRQEQTSLPKQKYFSSSFTPFIKKAEKIPPCPFRQEGNFSFQIAMSVSLAGELM